MKSANIICRMHPRIIKRRLTTLLLVENAHANAIQTNMPAKLTRLCMISHFVMVAVAGFEPATPRI